MDIINRVKKFKKMPNKYRNLIASGNLLKSKLELAVRLAFKEDYFGSDKYFRINNPPEL